MKRIAPALLALTAMSTGGFAQTAPNSPPYRPLPMFWGSTPNLTMRAMTGVQKIGPFLVENAEFYCVGSDANCPANDPPVDLYGGPRFQAAQGQHLVIHFRNMLKPLPPVPGQPADKPPSTTTNLHFHGGIVPATPLDPHSRVIGDNIFSNTDSTQAGNETLTYDYNIPPRPEQPSGLSWIHPHVHKLAKEQVSSGLAGMITVGAVRDYLCAAANLTTGKCTRKVNSSDFALRHIMLKDAQIDVTADPTAAAPGHATIVADTDPGRCANAEEADFNFGQCISTTDRNQRWLFTVNGLQYPSWSVSAHTPEVWRIQNASANITYKLSLRLPHDSNKVASPATTTSPGNTKSYFTFKVLSMDGAGIQPISQTEKAVTIPGTDQILLMPGSRADLLVDCRSTCTAGDYQLVTEKYQAGFAPDDADIWPRIALAKIHLPQTASLMASPLLALTNTSLSVNADMITTMARRITRSEQDVQKALANECVGVTDANKAAYSEWMTKLGSSADYHRRVYFGIYRAGDTEDFVIGDTIIDSQGKEYSKDGVEITDKSQIVLHTMNMQHMHGDMTGVKSDICAKYGQKETWELVNVSPEVHNFHIHQLKFAVATAADGALQIRTPSGEDRQTLPKNLIFASGSQPLLHDTIVIPRGVSDCIPADANGDPIANEEVLEPVNPPQPGYYHFRAGRENWCNWTDRSFDSASGQPAGYKATTGEMVVGMEFTGSHFRAANNGGDAQFVYHCHILEHEDKGMMATITVIDPDAPLDMSAANAAPQ